VTHLASLVGRYGPAVLLTAVALFHTGRIIALRRRLGHSRVFTAICFDVGIVTLLRQAELEEADLARRHGDRWTA
jgi:hypothetical protein